MQKTASATVRTRLIEEVVVRVAGFSAYFVELHITGQNDLIRRTELSM